MPDSPTPEPVSGFVCDCEEWMRPACAGEPFYKEHEGKQYCVFHLPSKEKIAFFERALQRKLENKDFNFRGVWFPDEVPFSKFDFRSDADFRGATFSANANFIAATFSAKVDFFRAAFSAEASFANAVFTSQIDFYDATFGAEADFRAVTFSASAEFRRVTFGASANFRYATFKDHANFHSATFGASADFFKATFSASVHFISATFNAAVDFSFATFSAAADFSFANFSATTNFSSATFISYFRFAGDEGKSVFSDASSLSLQFARVEKPERFSFHTLRLRPHWFVNIDARKFEFINVKWWLTTSQEIRDLGVPKNKTIWYSGERGFGASTHELLAIASRHLAVNAEDNHRYEEASRLRYLAMDVRRRERRRGLAFWRLSWWYWLASGYGERVSQAFLVLLGIWFVAGLLYTRVGFARWEPKLATEGDIVAAKRDEVGAPLKLSRALTYSAGVMTFQRPEPRPATTAAQMVVLLETILGPVQAALLALAIRRKFMR